MSWYSNMLKQTATYWAPATKDRYGNDSYSSPRTIICRWDDVHELMGMEGPSGGTIESRRTAQSNECTVFVNEDLQNKGYLYLGTSVAADPTKVAGALPISRFEKTPDVKNKVIVRIAYMLG